MLQELTHEDFTERVGERFRVELEDGEEMELELIKVGTLGQGVNRDSFSLEFRGPSEPILDQAIRELKNENGALSIFLVPIGPDKEGMLYEAVFT